MKLNKNERDLIKYVADCLMFSVNPTKVKGEKISFSIEGFEGNPTTWSGGTTTYTLGLMLSGMLLNMEVD